jgi:UDPglucose--hexose-1-phosphate uridylyltransferase
MSGFEGRQSQVMCDRFPQLRKDPIVDRWVLIAPERARRPTELEEPSHLAHHAACPFCECHESETPHEIYALRRAGTSIDGPGWHVRVIPNRFPAVRQDAESAYGVHEVVIECPGHEASMANLTVENVRDVFAVYRNRLAELAADPRLAYVQVFKNHGAGAGASVEHAHSQILGTAAVPRDVREEVNAASVYHSEYGRCIYCDLIERELSSDERVVHVGEHVVAIAASAGRFPHETWLLPRRHTPRYDQTGDPELAELAAAMRTILRKLASTAGDPPYNFVLHTAPAGDAPAYHWHWEIMPRTTGIAGYELATGCFINTLPPEEAAARLRER